MPSIDPQNRYSPKRPGRMTITVPGSLLTRLQSQADSEGRSLSNLAAYLLEVAMDQEDAKAS
jgi:hypothetical protein